MSFDLSGVMWAEATRDRDAEQAAEQLVRGKLAAARYWPFLAAAESEIDFGHRQALIQDDLAATMPEQVFSPVVASLREDWQLLHTARQEQREAALQRAAAVVVDQAPVAGQQYYHNGLGRWVAAGSKYPDSESSFVLPHDIHYDGSEDMKDGYRDARFHDSRGFDLRSHPDWHGQSEDYQHGYGRAHEDMAREQAAKTSKISYIDPTDAERYSHYPDMNPPVDNGGFQGLDGFVTGGEGEDRSQVGYARQLTPGQWVVTPGTEWPVVPNAGDPTQVPRTAANHLGRHDDLEHAYYSGHSVGQQARVQRLPYGMVPPNGERGSFTHARAWHTGYDHGHAGDMSGPGPEGLEEDSGGWLDRRQGQVSRTAGQHRAAGTPTHWIERDESGKELRWVSHKDLGRLLSDPRNGWSPDMERNGRVIHARDPQDGYHRFEAYPRGTRAQAQLHQAMEGIVPTPGPNPNYFSQGSEGLAGPPSFPVNPAGDLEPKTDNRMDDLYGAVPPQVSGGSAQGQVDGAGYSRNTDGQPQMGTSAGRLPFGQHRATEETRCGQCGTRLTQGSGWAWNDEHGKPNVGTPGSGDYHNHHPAEYRPPVTNPAVHTFDSTGEAYDRSQTDDHIKDGDVLSVPKEGVHGYLYKAWPIAVAHPGHPGAFHTFKGDAHEPAAHEDQGRYGASVAKAQEVAAQHGRQAVRRQAGRMGGTEPTFKPGDPVVNFRGEGATIHQVYPSNDPGKSHRVQVRWDDPARNATWDGKQDPEGAGDKNAYYEDVFAHHPSTVDPLARAVDNAVPHEQDVRRSYAAKTAANVDSDGWYTTPRAGYPHAESECPHKNWDNQGRCQGCGYSAGDEPDHEAWVHDSLGEHGMANADWLLSQNHTGPSKYSRRMAATDGRIVGHCDHCRNPVRYHTDEDGVDELRHLHNSSNRCSDGKRAATASLRAQAAFFDPGDPSVIVMTADATPGAGPMDSGEQVTDTNAPVPDPAMNATSARRVADHAGQDTSRGWWNLGVSDAHDDNARHEMIKREFGDQAHADYSRGWTDVGVRPGWKSPPHLRDSTGSWLESALRVQADTTRARPTWDNPTGAGDDYTANTWENQIQQRPMQRREDRGVNTPTTQQAPVPMVSSSDPRANDLDEDRTNNQGADSREASLSIEQLMGVS